MTDKLNNIMNKQAIHMIGVYTATMWLTFAGTVCASGEVGIDARIESAVIDASEAGYRFSVKMNAAGALESIEVEWAGKKLSFDKKDFGSVERVLIGGVTMVAPGPEATGRQDTVIMVLPYNEQRLFTDNDRTERHQFDVARLQFIDGKLQVWQKAEAIKGKTGKWKLTSKGLVSSDVSDGIKKVDANGVHDDGEISAPENPYIRIRIYEDSPRER